MISTVESAAVLVLFLTNSALAFLLALVAGAMAQRNEPDSMVKAAIALAFFSTINAAVFFVAFIRLLP